MGITSEILGNAAPAHELEQGGKVYRFGLIDQAVQAAWEKRLYEKDIEAVKIQKEAGLLSGHEYGMALARLTTAYRDGDYEMLSPSGIKLLQTLPGVRLLLALLLACSADEIVQLLLARRAEVVQKVRLVLAESFPGLDLPGTAANGQPAEGHSPN